MMWDGVVLLKVSCKFQQKAGRDSRALQPLEFASLLGWCEECEPRSTCIQKRRRKKREEFC